MSEETTKKQEMPEQLSDILLVLDKEKMKIQAVKSIDENGKMETVDPTKKNQNQFMRVDKSGDFFSNFFSNFFSQLKNPTNFSFFKVPAPIAIEKAQKMQKQVDKPTPEGEKVMKEHEVKTEPQQDKKQENQKNMATTQTTPEASEYRYKPEQIDWDTMKNLGLSKEYLEKRNLLDPLLRGYKTNELLPIGVNFGGSVLRTDARLSLQQAEDGNVIVAIHGIKKEPNLHFEFFGHKFTDEDKKNLLETGNMGRVVIRVNRFLVQGEGNIKYTYNNGIIAKDEKLAATNFLNALEKLPGYIEQEKKKIAEIQKDLPVLQEVVNGSWSKENRLSELKTELAAVERKIQLSITPETKEEPAEQVEKQKQTANNSENIVRTKGIHLPRGVL